MGRDGTVDSTRGVARGEVRPHVQAGEERRGFEIFPEDADHVVRLRLWGAWDMPLAKEFRRAVLDVARRLTGKPWWILSDSRLFYVQSPEIALFRQEIMSTVTRLGCQKIAAVVSSARYSQQFFQMADDSHVRSAVFLDDADALDWIRGSGARS
jgi:hypothetical protein